MTQLYDWFVSPERALARVIIMGIVLVAAHLSVRLIRRWGGRFVASSNTARVSKTRTLASLLTSILVFALYFVAFGVALQELGVSLRAYLASASIVGLAIGFGSQGLVQDVVTGLTLVFSDLVDVGDMVEISGQTGIVCSVGIRFTVLENALGGRVYIPNRTIANVINYPKGYVRVLVGIALTDDTSVAREVEESAAKLMKTFPQRFPGVFRQASSVEPPSPTENGERYLRLKFRVWPGRGGLIETVFRDELLAKLKSISPEYENWMVTVTYEAESRAKVRDATAH